jgi:hypothetical protein
VGQNEVATSVFHRVASAYVPRLFPLIQATIQTLSGTLCCELFSDDFCMIPTNSDRRMTRLEVGERVLLYLLDFISAMANSYH